jgi:hypothetical protein
MDTPQAPHRSIVTRADRIKALDPLRVSRRCTAQDDMQDRWSGSKDLYVGAGLLKIGSALMSLRGAGLGP